MCLSFHRSPRRSVIRRPSIRRPSTPQQHGVRTALRVFVDTTTLISPTHNASHSNRHIVTSRERSVIYLGAATLARLEHVFYDLCHRSPTFYNSLPLPAALKATPTLSRERLTRFLENIQGESVVYPLEKERYRLEEFLEVLAFQYSWAAARLPLADEVFDLSLPISHYFISSSHNTYLVGNQLSSEASVHEYEKVLESNCRCIEIDVWNPPAKSGRQSRGRSPYGPKTNHGHHIHHLSSNSVANSIHDSFEVVANLIVFKVSHSRASSFSQRSRPATAAHVEPTSPSPEKPDQHSREVVRARFRAAGTRLMSQSAVVDDADDDDANESRGANIIEQADHGNEETTMRKDSDTASTDGTEMPSQISQTTSDKAIAKISVTPPDALVGMSAEDMPDDTDPDQEPVVMHAHNFHLLNTDLSLGTHVPFRKVCQVVRNNAFRSNPLPIIVSLEVHTNALQQRKMAKIMKEEWGDLLLDRPLDGIDPRLQLPTLGELLNKILVKVKKPCTTQGSAVRAGVPLATPDLALERSAVVPASEDDIPLELIDVGSFAVPAFSTVATTNAAASVAAKSTHITEELGGLAIYSESRHFNGSFADDDAKVASHVFSLSETAIQALHQKQHEHLFNHNKAYLMRAYPNATKHILSTNPDPACSWRRGVQMVALNWQTLDKAMMLNYGMFSGSHGWVRKPEGFREPVCGSTSAFPAGDAGTAVASSTRSSKSSVASSDNDTQVAMTSDPVKTCPVGAALPTYTLDLCITVLAGQHLPLPPALQKKNNKLRFSDKRVALGGATGVISGRSHFDFRPVVKCELNVERAEERCPEAVMGAPAAAAPVGTKMPPLTRVASTTQASGGNQLDHPTFVSPAPGLAGPAGPAGRLLGGMPSASAVKIPEAVLKQKTSVNQSDQPDWGAGGETLRFMNVRGIVESLSFVVITVEDEGSRTARERAGQVLGFNGMLAGWTCIRLDRLQTGYRFLSLMDSQGQATDGKLLVRIEKLIR